MGKENKGIVGDVARQEDRRELEVLLALAASELAGKNRTVKAESPCQANSTAGGISRA